MKGMAKSWKTTSIHKILVRHMLSALSITCCSAMTATRSDVPGVSARKCSTGIVQTVSLRRTARESEPKVTGKIGEQRETMHSLIDKELTDGIAGAHGTATTVQAVRRQP